MQFDKETFCPYIQDQSTQIRKFLYCEKVKGLCRMVKYFPNGQMQPIQDVKNIGCPYGYKIEDVEKKEDKNNEVTSKDSNSLNVISVWNDEDKIEEIVSDKSNQEKDEIIENKVIEVIKEEIKPIAKKKPRGKKTNNKKKTGTKKNTNSAKKKS